MVDYKRINTSLRLTTPFVVLFFCYRNVGPTPLRLVYYNINIILIELVVQGYLRCHAFPLLFEDIKTIHTYFDEKVSLTTQVSGVVTIAFTTSYCYSTLAMSAKVYLNT